MLAHRRVIKVLRAGSQRIASNGLVRHDLKSCMLNLRCLRPCRQLVILRLNKQH
jgi:hypothetical protein